MSIDCIRHPGTEATHMLGRSEDWKPADPAEPDRYDVRMQPDVWEPHPLCRQCVDELTAREPEAVAELVTEL